MPSDYNYLRLIFGIPVILISILLAIYNVNKTKDNTITGPTISLIFSAFLGFAFCLNMNFEVFGFKTKDFDEKLEIAKRSATRAQKANLEAKSTLNKVQSLVAISLMSPSRFIIDKESKTHRSLGKSLLKELYKEDYKEKVKSLMDNNILPKEKEYLELSSEEENLWQKYIPEAKN